MTESMEHGELRDRLVDLVHETGDAAVRAQVSQAVAADPDLADELAFLHAARAALTPLAPSVSVDRIVAAIPAYVQQRPVRFSQWRIAAAVATIALGGMSLTIVQQAFRGDAASELTFVEPESLGVSGASANGLRITFGQGLSEMEVGDVDVLLAGLSDFDGLPSTEPGRSVPVLPQYDEGGD